MRRSLDASFGRRAFLRHQSLVMLAGAAAVPRLTLGTEPPHVPASAAMRVALLTDLHYADKPTAGTRHYRDTLEKMSVAADHFENVELDFAVELGDFIDAADSVSRERSHLRRINADFERICDDRHYVLGNHCVHTLTKPEFLDEIERDASYGSFDRGEFHFVLLDACFRSDGQAYGRKNFEWTDANVPGEELDWLRNDLSQTDKPTIVFVHQRLDVSNHYGIKNADAVRRVLQESGRVRCVFQGHSHRNDYRDLAGIHYCTLAAMVEGQGPKRNAFSILTITGNTLTLDGFVDQQDYRWPPHPAQR